MKLSNFLRRGLAMFLLLAMLVTLVPSVFAAEETGDIDNIVIDIPDHLKDEDVVTASFGEDGKIVYEEASDEVRAAINAGGQTTSAITDSSGTTILENRAGNDFAKAQRLAFFIDPSNSEGNTNYSTFSLTAARVQNLVAAGVTDLFVMTKNRAGTFSLTDLKTANTNKGSAKVYAWMHCARDAAYLKNNKNSAQYHFRTGFNNIENGGDTGVSGWVNLGYAAYITYMEGLVGQATSYADGLLLDSVRFGTEYTGWGQEAKDYMGTTNYNNAVKAMCATAGSSNYSYTTGSDGFYKYKAGTSAASGLDLYEIIMKKDTSGNTVSPTTAQTNAATSLGNYRKSVITNFIGKMKTKFGTSKIIAVALERDWENTNYYKYIKGQDPYNFRNHVKKGFCVTMQVRDYHSTAPSNMAKQVAKYTNVMIGVDFYKVGTVGNYGYTYPDTITDVAEEIFTARYTVAQTYKTYRGYILGAACYTMGHIGAIKASLSGSGTGPTLTATISHPNSATKAMLTYFNKHGDSDCSPATTDGSQLQLNGTIAYYSNSGEINSRNSMTGVNIAAFGAATIQVKLKNYTVDWDKLPFIRFGFYVPNSISTYVDCIGHFPIYIIANHASCTSFTTTWISAAANCTTKGFKQHKCKTCSYTYIEEVAALGHDYSVEQSRVNPTCEATGSVTYKCSRCTATKTDTIAALGHNYVATVTPPTCISQGYTTHVCSNDASHTYIDSYTPITEHTFVGGVCSHCGFSLATLIHFKEGAVENTWDWQLVGGSGLGFDTSTDGAMYGSTNGMTQAYFYIDPMDIGDLGYKIVDGDVIQIRMRVRATQSTETTVTPSVSLETAAGTAYGPTLSGSALDLTTSEWQIITIPITGYTAGDVAERIRINVFGEALAAGYVEIDYVHFGVASAAPITVTFHDYRGKVLQTSMIAPGTTVTYYGETPTKPSSAGFEYTFAGWYATGVDGTTSSLITDLSKVAFSQNTALTPGFTSVRVPTEPLDSDKRLVDDDEDLEDYTYDIEIDASTYGQMVTINKEYKKPLDITIVMDRSTSTCFPADESNTSMTWTVTNNTTSLTNVLNKLDKTKPEGYYTATNWLGVDYVGPTDIQAGGYISYEDMKWDGSKWVVWQTLELYTEAPTKYTTALKAIYTDGAYELVRPASVLYKYSNYTYHHTTFGKWVPLATAYTDFFARCQDSFDDAWETSHGLSGYNEANMKFKIAVSRRGKMQEALTKFVDSIYESTSQLPQGQYHRVSIVSYGYQAYVKDNTFTFTNAAGSTGTYTCSTDPGVTITPVTLSSAANVTAVKNVINKPFAFGATSTDQGLKFAAEHQTTMRNSSNTSQGVVILFTDGAPTYGDGFFINTANNALTQANSMKNNGTTIFSVGYMDGLNATGTLKAWSDSNSISDQANTFLHYVSSNYPSPTSMTVPGSGDAKAGYYMSDTTGLNLANVFGSIYTITDTTTKVDTQITGSLLIKDTVTREWNVLKENDAWDIKVEKCLYKGMGEFDKGVALESDKYVLTTTELSNGDTEIQVEWKDAPNAWLREAEEATNGYMGYKILVTIGIQLDRDSTIGGNNIPTNTPDSGIFYPTNPDLDHYYVVPNVNVELEYDHLVHDYFLDLYNDAAEFDYLDVLNNTDKKGEYLLGIYEDFFTRTVDTDGLNNRFVDIEHFAGNDVYSIYLEHGTKDWAPTFFEPEFDFLTDLAGIPVRYEVRPLTNNKDSFGREPFAIKRPVQTAMVNYYGPKYVVVDYGTTAKVPMGNEIPDELPMSLGANGTFNNTNTHVLYDFKHTATDDQHIMKAIEEIGYTVTAINKPKSAETKQIARKIHVIPANTVEYDYDLLKDYEYVAGSGYTGNWIPDGSDNNLDQNSKNDERHGYDSTLVTAKSNYSFGRSYVTTVSANIRNEDGSTEYHNNDALTFNFVGTGFDIISQTGPQEGVMVVEVYAVDANGNAASAVTARYLVDNYLSTKDLYQLPVVHCTDLPHGEYKVVIRAFYNDAFNHYTPAGTAGISNTHVTKAVNVMTEAKLRQILGLSEDDVLEYSLSNDRGIAKRAMSASSYDVHVDGIRIYNTLGTLSEKDTPVAYATYGAEANAQFVNARSILLDSASWISNVDESGNMTSQGMVYLAGNGIGNTNASAMDGAVHLSMSGILNHEYDETTGRYYILNTSNKRVQHPEYKTDLYFKMNANNTIVSDDENKPLYFCLDGNGAEVTLSAEKFQAIIGKENIAFFNSKYDVAGPKNEIYLADTYGIAFNASGATLLQVSLNSLDGSAVVLEAYDWTEGTFVPATASTTNAATMYYDLHSYMSDTGNVIIRNNGTGIISISNVKVIGAEITAPASTVALSLRIMQSFNEIKLDHEYDENLKINTSITVGAEMQIVYTIPAGLVESVSDFYIEITKEVADGEDIITIYDLDGENQLVPVMHPTTGELVAYRAIYTGINAKEMGDSFNAILFVIVDGTTYYGADNTTSIKEFLLTKYNSASATDAFKTFAIDMLNYGAAAQAYFDYDVENLVNADLTEEQKAFGTQTLPTAVDNSALTGDGLNLNTGVTVKSKVTLVVTCLYAPEDASNVVFVIKDTKTGDVLAELAPSNVVAGRAVQGTYDNVGAKEMRNLITIEVYDGDKLVSKTLNWSIESYVASILAKDSTTESQRNMVNAMLTYGDSAAAYLNG